MTQFGQHAAPTHVIAHISDTHFLSGDRALHGAIATHANLLLALAQLERSGTSPAAIVFTGDLADLAEPGAYRSLREMVEPVAERLGAQVVWGIGNHDERPQYATELFDEPIEFNSVPTQDRVYDVDGLRIIAVDSTVPGYHHGDLTDAQLAWLADELATPARYGTLIAMHHPPIPTPIELMAVLELRGQDRLAEVIRGTDVRAILAGHLHYATHGSLAGVPVSVAAATCYTMDLSAPLHTLSGIDGGQAINLVHVYSDQLVHSVVPIGGFAEISGFSALFLERMAALSPEERREVFSSKASTMTIAEVEAGRRPPSRG
ncbi:MAG: 3,5-cyclic-AMP phosphodiesterase [Pseudonocardiales bacterium]|nr:3,5-cyclic-AMP phosphodiesterase [Pseudonocardiales bacterium]